MGRVYETERLILKTLGNSMDEAELTLDFYKRNKEHLKTWDPLRNEEFYELKTRKRTLTLEVNSMRNMNYFRLWIFKKTDAESEKIIGTIGVCNIIRGVFQSCMLGYCIDKDEVNNGYITEAVEKTINILFKEYKLHRTEANIMPKNKASLKVVKKLGFKEEGLAKKYLKINGKWEDHIHMVLLNEAVE